MEQKAAPDKIGEIKVCLLGFCGTCLSPLCPAWMRVSTPHGDKDFSHCLSLLCHCLQPWPPTLVCSLVFSLLFCKMGE